MSSARRITGYVAFLDVLGFSDLIARDDSLNHVQQYTEAIEEAVSLAGEQGQIQFALFSDSIIISTDSPEESALASLVAVCSRIFGRLIALQVPVRGAISYGSYIRSAEGTGTAIVAGRPINDAYDWERRQDWIGVSLTASVLRHVSELGEKCEIKPINSEAARDDFESRLCWLPYLQRYDEIPFHRQSSGEPNLAAGFAVVPTVASMKDMSTVHTGFGLLMHSAEAMRILGPDPGAQRKCAALTRFLAVVAQRWSHLSNSSGADLLVELQPKIAVVLARKAQD